LGVCVVGVQARAESMPWAGCEEDSGAALLAVGR
jgi:hypothetical protein